MLTIRKTIEADKPHIERLHRAAFGDLEGPIIVGLLKDLFEDNTAEPLLSLVAMEDDDIKGHVLFTHVELKGVDLPVKAQILAPLAVAPDCQNKGLGGKLIIEGLKRLKEQDIKLVFVLGHPEYYPRFGFKPAGALGLKAPHPIPEEHADAWMVLELQEGILGAVKGAVNCSGVLGQPQYWGP